MVPQLGEDALDVVKCLSEPEKKRIRLVAYLLTVLSTFSLGVTEIFAPWYAGILHASPWEMGWAMASFGIVYMFSPALGGKVSDRIGRKRSIAVATIAYICVLLIYPQPFVMPIHLIMIRALEGLFFGLFNPSIEGMVAELCPDSQVAVLGNFSSSWSVGMILSPFVIGYMAVTYGHVTSIYVVLAMELVVLALILLLVKPYTMQQLAAPTRTGDAPHETEPTKLVPDARPPISKTSNRFVASYFSVALFGFTSTVLLSLFPTYVQNLPGYVTTDFGVLLAVWNITRTFAFLGLTKTPREYMGNVMIVGAILTGVSMFLVYGSTLYVLLAAAMVLCGIGVGFNYLGALYIVVSATEKEKGAHAGLVESLAGVGFFVGPILGGWIAGGEVTSNLPYLLTAVYAVLSLVIIVALLKRKK